MRWVATLLNAPITTFPREAKHFGQNAVENIAASEATSFQKIREHRAKRGQLH
jgi:hypothetical protein